MTWQHYLRLRTREPRFLWRMSLGILAVGAVVGLAVDWALPAWIDTDEATELNPRDSGGWSDLDQLAAQSHWAAVWWGVPRLIVAQWRAPLA